MKRNKAAWALGLAFALAQSAYAAVIAPSLLVRVDDYDYPVPVIRDPGGSERWFVDNYYMDTGGAQMMISATIDPDPSIAYGIAITDVGAPSTFSFTFTTFIVPTGSPNIVNASLVGGLTDATGDGVSMTPTLPDGDGDLLAELQAASVGVGSPTTNMGVDVGLAFLAPAGPPGAFHNYLSTAAGPQPGPGGGPFDVLSTTFAFLGSGGGDIASMTGFASIEFVPEPAALGLMALAVPMLARRRRR